MSKAESRSGKRGVGQTGSFEAGHDVKATSRLRDQALKRMRGEISCAECFRLKARCDKKVPCSSCVKRGCQAICPNGSLRSGQNAKIWSADTERLHRRIADMGERIRQLEDALAILQTNARGGPHPLLKEELLAMKYGFESKDKDCEEESHGPKEDEELADAFGTLMISNDGSARFFGMTGGSESLLGVEKPDEVLVATSNSRKKLSYKVPPLDPGLCQDNILIRIPFEKIISTIEAALPTWERANALAETYLLQGSWLLRPIKRDQLMDELLPSIYQRSSSGYLPCLDTETYCYSSAKIHELGLVLMVFAHGSFADLTLNPFNSESEHYHQLVRELLSLSIVTENPSLALVQCLLLTAMYTINNDRKPMTEGSRSISSLAYVVGRDIGLQRDPAKWNIPEKLARRRRDVHWQCLFLENSQSIVTGRPPLTTLKYEDCQFPEDMDGPIDANGTRQPGFWTWAYRFSRDIVYKINDLVSSMEPLKYSDILDIDRQLREFEIPPYLRIPDRGSNWEDDGPVLVLQRFMVKKLTTVTMFHLHVSFFVKAVLANPKDPVHTPYGPSFLAAYSNALGYINLVLSHCEVCPGILLRSWAVCVRMFTALIIMGTVVVLAPTSRLAGSALREMNLGIGFVQNFAVHSRRAHKALSMLLYLRDAALRVFASSDTDPAKIEIDYQLLFWALGIFSGQTSYVHSNKHRPPEENSPMALGLPLDAPSLATRPAEVTSRLQGLLPPTNANVEMLGSFALSPAELELIQDLSQSFPQSGSSPLDQQSGASQAGQLFNGLAFNMNGFDSNMFDSEMATSGDINRDVESWGWDPQWYQAEVTTTPSFLFRPEETRSSEVQYPG